MKMENIEEKLDCPKPTKNKTYKELSQNGHSGVLMQKDTKFFNCIPCWNKKFVVVSESCVYLFKNENDRSYEKAFSLFGYRQVARADEASTKSGPFPFKISYTLDEVEKFKYFSALDNNERNVWMKVLKKELVKAHKLSSFETMSTTSSDSGIFDTETPISTSDYFDRYKRRSDLHADDSDLEREYSYITEHDVKPIIKNKPNSCSMTMSPPARIFDNKTRSVGGSSSSSRVPPPLPPFILPDSPTFKSPIKKSTSNQINRPDPSTRNAPGENTSTTQNAESSKIRFPVSEKLNFEKQARWDGHAAEGKKYLVQYGAEGTYMIRKSEKNFDVLEVISEYQPRKFKIFQGENYVTLDGEKKFDSTNKLILHYKNNDLPKRRTKLTCPISERLPG
ncbi:hypothetical protein HELRODRAFT_188901 [Helobdella robusta]|uniref:PH domain-containing protein n=1 Tax=Helobdella robusta TaxID=6412 RepID=T1FQG5_HELRO|nr:hypothetical protein HELRODRAFT_188901 [Helobdella robusta]ESN98757.1 hypothetical protein HELRODRAFT_188901 [Helobdella robusta]